MSAIQIDRLQDGKIAEHWSVSDTAALMQQLQT
ncbi:MAG: ester cyclase [Stigonema ocellatum SAG 48.90 = DSM 106950]|nr:ester cyclase [Stigonema ocellatum SAG 48.90 = DSM 106950]